MAIENGKALRKGEMTRERILDRAADMASIYGLDNLTIGSLAADLGLSKSGLYAHFGSKEEILYAIALKMTRDPQEQHLPLLDAEGTPTERLASLIEAHVRNLADNRVEHLVSLRELPALTPEHLARVQDDHIAHLAGTPQVWEEWQERFDLSNGTDDIGSIGTAASHGCIRMRIPDVEELYDEVPVQAPVYIA